MKREHLFEMNIKPQITAGYDRGNGVAADYVGIMDSYDVANYAIMSGWTPKTDMDDFADEEICAFAKRIPTIVREVKPTVIDWLMADNFEEAERTFREATGISDDAFVSAEVINIRDGIFAGRLAKDHQFKYVTINGWLYF